MKNILPEMVEIADGDEGEAMRLQAAMESVAPREVVLSGSFNAALRERLAEPDVGHARRQFIARMIGVAAMVLLGIFLGGVMFSNRANPLGGSIAWADVVRAVKKVDHVHISAFMQEPHNAAAPKMYRLDLYYQQPGQWRGQGLDYVQFTSAGGKGARIYSVKEGKWISPEQSPIHLIPEDIVRDMGDKGLLDVVLEKVFDGKPPAGEPVKNDELATAGIEVFDYAYDPSAMWARIWVVKDSRMPIRMKVYHPEFNDYMLVEFDYSEPEGPGFFDAVAFEKVLATNPATTDADAIYGIGSAPILGSKPQNASQINAASGGYHAPMIRRVLSNEEHDIAVITSIPMNRTPQGQSLTSERYEPFIDSWGNRYIPSGQESGVRPAGDGRWYFSIVEPFKTGTSPRTVTLSYVSTVFENGKPGPHDEVIGTDTVAVPDSSVKGEAQDWDIRYLLESKKAALQGYLESTGTLQEQLTAVETALANDPNSVSDLLWKHKLLRQHNREAQAWKLFEQRLLEPMLSEMNYRSATVLGQYLIYLPSAGRMGDVDALVARLEKIRDAGMASKDRNIVEQTKQAFTAEWSLLAQAMHMHEWQRQIEGHTPQVLRTIASKDGFVCVEMKAPTQPQGWDAYGHSRGPHWNLDYGWFWDAVPEGQQLAGRLADNETGDLWIVFRPETGATADHVKIGGTVQLIRDNYESGHANNAVTYEWFVEVGIPDATVESMPAWWAMHTAGRNAEEWFAQVPAWKAPVAQGPTVVDAEGLMKAGNFVKAAEEYQKILAQGDDANVRVYLVKALVSAGNLADAKGEIEKMRAALPQKMDPLDGADMQARKLERTAELAYVRALISRKEFAAARAEMAEMEKDRPRLADIPDRTVNVDLGHGGWTTRNLRQSAADAWREFDAVWWDLRDGEQSAGF